MSAEVITDTPDEVVAAVADAIRASGLPKPRTEEEQLQRELEIDLWHQDQEWHREQRRIERERAQAEAVERERRQAAIVAEQQRNKANRERQEQIARPTRERELRDLCFRVAQHQAWQHNVQTAARNAVAIQRWEALMADLEPTINPPAAPPEPEIVYVEAEEGSD